jgi:hypothetical protein
MPVAVNGSNFGNTIISKYKGVMYDLKNKIKNLPSLLQILRSLSICRTILSPPIIAQSNFFLQSLNI